MKVTDKVARNVLSKNYIIKMGYTGSVYFLLKMNCFIISQKFSLSFVILFEEYIHCVSKSKRKYLYLCEIHFMKLFVYTNAVLNNWSFVRTMEYVTVVSLKDQLFKTVPNESFTEKTRPVLAKLLEIKADRKLKLRYFSLVCIIPK